MSDLEQRELAVRRAIAKYRNEPDFPKFEDYIIIKTVGLTKTFKGSIHDYFYAQTPQGTMEDEKRKFTIYGVLLIVPVAVMSFFFRDVMELLYGLLIGGVLSALYYLYLRNREKRRWQRFEDAQIEKYIEEVLKYKIKEK